MDIVSVQVLQIIIIAIAIIALAIGMFIARARPLEKKLPGTSYKEILNIQQ